MASNFAIEAVYFFEDRGAVFRGEGMAAFAIDPDDLLGAGDDALFGGGAGSGFLDETGFSYSATAFEDLLEIGGGEVIPYPPGEGDVGGELGKIARDVCGTSQEGFFAGDFDNRDGSFGRNARDVPPNKGI